MICMPHFIFPPQATLGGYSDSITGIPPVSMETKVPPEKNKELLDQQLKDQVSY